MATLNSRARSLALSEDRIGESCTGDGRVTYSTDQQRMLLCSRGSWQRVRTDVLPEFRYYRIFATSWTNGYLLMCNLSMFAPGSTEDLLFDGSGVVLTSDSATGGSTAAQLDDHYNITVDSQWPQRCIQTSNSGAHWIQVDFGSPTVIERFGLHGYPGGSHKPTGNWFLQGSVDGSSWEVVWTGEPEDWPTGPGGSYPVSLVHDISGD